MGDVQIEILGRVYALTSDRPADHLQEVAAFVDRRLRELGHGRPEAIGRDHAILAALNIASELFLLRERSEKLAETADARIAEVIESLDRVAAEGETTLGGPSYPPPVSTAEASPG